MKKTVCSTCKGKGRGVRNYNPSDPCPRCKGMGIVMYISDKSMKHGLRFLYRDLNKSLKESGKYLEN